MGAENEADACERERLTLALGAADLGVWEWQPGKGFTHLSARCLEIMGPVRCDDLEESLLRVHPDDRGWLRERAEVSFEIRGPLETEFRILGPGGSIRVLRAVGRWQETPAEGERRLVGVVQDVTETRHAAPIGHGSPFEPASDAPIPGLAPIAQTDLALVIDSIPHLVSICDPEFRIVFLNRPFREFLGRRRAAYAEVVHPEDLAAVSAAQLAVSRGENARSPEVRLLRRDGAHRWFETRTAPLRDSRGAICGWVCTHTDIEQARQLRSALAREEERYQRIASLAPGLLYEARQSPDGKISLPIVSARAEEFLGFPQQALAADAELMWSRVCAEERAEILASIERAVESGSDWRHEFRYRHPRGEDIWLEFRAAHEPLPDGCRLWRGLAQDVSARKRAEEALRTSQGQLMAALNAGAMGSWTCDMLTGRMQADEAALGFWGVKPGDTLPDLQGCSGRVHPEDRSRFFAQFAEIERAGVGQVEPYRVQAGDGPARWISSYAVLERDSEGRTRRISGVHVDVTDRKRMEESALQSQKLEALGRLAGGIAHDFNNVLTAIAGNAELIAGSVPALHPAAESIAEIQRASERAAALVRQILAFSRPELARREVLALGSLVREGLRMLRATLPASLELRLEIPDELPPVLVDATQVHQIVVNLVTNAANAIGTRPGCVELALAAIEIDAEREGAHPTLAPGRWVRLSVRDDGAGMTRETRARVFDPFFTTRREGNGLGLAIVHRIVTAHGGAIEVESEPGAGALFRVWLPAARGGQVEKRPPKRSRDPATPRRRVLFVDDEPSIVALAGRALRRFGCEVTGCSEPLRALDRLRQAPLAYDVLVTDASMPGISGFELVRAARSLHPDLPVLVQSGNVRSEDQAEAKALAVDGLLQKPCAAEQLAAAIENALRSRAALRPGSAG